KSITCLPVCPSISSLFRFPIPPSSRPTLFPYTTLFRSTSLPYSYGISAPPRGRGPDNGSCSRENLLSPTLPDGRSHERRPVPQRSEEHTSELQSRFDLVCRLLLEKKKTNEKRRQLYKRN